MQYVNLFILKRRFIVNTKYKRIIIYIYIVAAFCGMVSFSIPMFGSIKSAKANDGNDTEIISGSAVSEPSSTLLSGQIAQNSVTNVTPEPTVTPTAAPTPTVSADADPYVSPVPDDIQSLIEDYYAARLVSVDETLKYVYDSDSISTDDMDENTFLSRIEYISAYHNIEIYLKPAAGEIDYVAYVMNDIEIPTISTYAPSLDEIYIKIDENGTPKIYVGTLSVIAQDYVDALADTADIKALVTKNRKAMKKARKADEDLNAFISHLEDSIK
jgi:hypothetical protein